MTARWASLGLEKAYGRTEPRLDMSEADAAVEIEFDARGLVPVIAQEVESGQVLTLAYANAEAIARTAETELAHYYSRSREELWQKGETSGHVQRVAEIRIDCDGDAMLYRVSQKGGACHTGYETCFYRSVEGVSVDREDEHGSSADAIADSRESGDTGSEGAETGTSDAGTLAVETEITADRVFDPDAVYE